MAEVLLLAVVQRSDFAEQNGPASSAGGRQVLPPSIPAPGCCHSRAAPRAVPGHSLTVSVLGALAGGGRSGTAELGPGPGVGDSRAGEEEEGLEVGALATESVCGAEERRAASAVGPEPRPAFPAASIPCRVEGAAGWSWTGTGHPRPDPLSSPLPLAYLHSPHRYKCLMQASGHPKLPQPCSAHQHETPQTHLLLPQAKLPLHEGGQPHPQPETKRMPGINWPLQSPQLFHSLLFFFFFSPCLSYFFCLFCLGILSTPAKEKKKLITEKSYVLCWQIAQGALSALIRLCRGAAARCCPQPPAGS